MITYWFCLYSDKVLGIEKCPSTYIYKIEKKDVIGIHVEIERNVLNSDNNNRSNVVNTVLHLQTSWNKVLDSTLSLAIVKNTHSHRIENLLSNTRCIPSRGRGSQLWNFWGQLGNKEERQHWSIHWSTTAYH